MEKIAVIADIHGNVPALEAVLKDIEERNITRIICLGDLAGKGPNSDQTVDIIRERCEMVVQGNWDAALARNEDFGVWHKEQLGPERLAYLDQLPFSTEFFMSGRLIRLLHASPQSVFHRVHPRSPFEEREAMFDNTELTENIAGERRPDVLGYGDIHGVYIQNFQNRSLFNVGSVGNPLDINQASYGILEGTKDTEKFTSFGIQFIRVPYDLNLAIEHALATDMPERDAYIQELRTAVYRHAKK